MKKLFIICLVIVACKRTKTDPIVMKQPVDSFRRHMIENVQRYRAMDQWDSATNYLNGLADTVQELNQDRLSLYWRLEKIQQLNAKKQFDSASSYMNKALKLLGSPQMTYKDSFNSYTIYLYLLQSQQLTDSALHIANEAYYLAKDDSSKITTICIELAKLYGEMNDMPNARKYLMKGWEFNTKPSEYTSELSDLLAGYYLNMNNVDSAIYFFNIAKTTPGRYSKEPSVVAAMYENIGTALVEKGRLQEALENQLKAKSILDSLGIKRNSLYNNLADTYGKLGELKKAFTLIDSAIALCLAEKDYHTCSIALGTKSELYLKEKEFKKAYGALDSSFTYYTYEMDSSLRYRARELETQYAVREKDHQINSLAVANAANERVRKQQRLAIILMIVSILFLFIIGWQFWRRRKTEMLLRETNLKQQLLRAQLDQHFLSNSIAAIKNLLRFGENEKAVSYITSLAKLMRFIFENAQKNHVLLGSEIEALHHYLNLQSMYHPGLFDYEIEVYKDYEEDEIYIPPMLLQPFVENSITHGFSGIDYKGRLVVKIGKNADDTLYVLIDDNGKGLWAPDRTSRVSSTAINKERLSIIANQTRKPVQLEVIDKVQTGENGTRVEIHIPVLS
jgi:tetratricopeptide (TPR) repeat protein